MLQCLIISAARNSSVQTWTASVAAAAVAVAVAAALKCGYCGQACSRQAGNSDCCCCHLRSSAVAAALAASASALHWSTAPTRLCGQLWLLLLLLPLLLLLLLLLLLFLLLPWSGASICNALIAQSRGCSTIAAQLRLTLSLVPWLWPWSDYH